MHPSRKSISSILSQPVSQEWPVFNVDILGGFLDTSFRDFIKYSGRLAHINLNVNPNFWSSTLSCINSSLPDCDILIVPVSLHELSNLNDDFIPELISKFSSFIQHLTTCDRYSSIFFLVNTLSPIPSSSYIHSSKPVRDFYKLINSFFDYHDSKRVFCIDVNSIDSISDSQYRDWILYGFPCPLHTQFKISKIVVSTILSKSGLGKKIIVLDLDETLWPFLLGDLNSPSECCLDAALPIHRFYIDFQRYLLSLRSKGFLLSIASKNDPSKVQSLFSGSGHPFTVNDFVSPILSWDSKSSSLQSIASNLNLSLDSFVFIDNSPSEVSEMKNQLPQVLSICVGDDPSQFISICDNELHLSSLYIDAFSESRENSYKLSTNLSSVVYDTHVSISLNSPELVDRTLQLLNKTNQFNLTGSKTSPDILSECPFIFAFSLKDQFQDYGLTSVILAHCLDAHMVINQWVLSCRTFSRGFELDILRVLGDWCLAHNISSISSTYSASPKNLYLQNLFSSTESNLPIPVSFSIRS